MSRFAIQQFRCNGASSYYAGARSYGINRGRRVDPQGTDGTKFESAHHITEVAPEATITSRALKSMALLLVGSADVPMVSLDGSNGLIMAFAKGQANGPGFAGGSVHLTRQALRGLIYLAGLRWTKGQKAEAHLRGMFYSPDGTTASIVPSTGSLPTQPVPDYGFALQSVVVAGQTISTIDSLSFDCDPKFKFEHTAGLPEPTSISGGGPNGQIEYSASADVGDCDLGEGVGTSVFTFLQYAHGGGFGTGQVIVTLNSSWSIEETLGGDNGTPAKRQLKMRSIYDGINLPCVITTV